MKFILIASSAALLAGSLLVSGNFAQPVHAQQASTPARGESLFKQRCAMCHAVAGKGGKLGPDLAKVVGRKAGSTSYAYSPAMKASKLVWNAKTLDTYLAAPMKAVPGTKMVVAVPAPADRAAIISYLAGTK